MNGQLEESDEIQDELEWLRLCLNFWTAKHGAWLPVGAWQACADPKLEIPDGADIYVAVDAAHSYDTTAVAWAWRAPDGRVVVRTHVWSCRKAAPADTYVEGGELDNEDLVEPFIHQLAERYRVREVVGDPNYFATELRHLGRRFLTAPQFPQSKEQTEAVQEFYRAVRAKRIAHAGSSSASGGVLAAHVDAIAGEKTSASGYWKIRKLVQSNPIDAGMAALIAHGRALLAPKPSIYNDRGLRFIDDPAPLIDDDDDDLSEADLARRMRRERQ